jgi:large subunit ribosomal protein L1
MTISKSLKKSYETFNREEKFSIEKAVEMMKKLSTVKFDATAEVHFTLGIDPRQAEQQIRSTVALPHGTGKKVRVVVFCGDDQVKIAKSTGAMEAGNEDLIEKVGKGWTDFDVAVATPEMMPKLGKIARTLGTRGLMPSPKAGTVTPEIEKTVKALILGRIEIRNDKNAIVHSIFGKLNFDESKLVENLKIIISAIKEAKSVTVKGEYIKQITINSTMGAGIRISLES